MALSPLRSKFFHHNRSLSLPSKSTLSHLNEHLSDAEVSDATCSSLASMENRVKGLRNFYISIDDLLMLRQNQKIINISQEKQINQVLDGHIRLLDACSTTKDLISNTKHNVQSLLSALRRKDANGINGYLNSRRKSKKDIQKSLKDLRSFKSKSILSTPEKECAASELHELSEAESITIATLESLMSYLNGTSMQDKQKGWSLVAKLMHPKKFNNEFEKMDELLQMSIEGVQVEELMNLSKEIESSIRNLEEELECLFRKLIRTRVLLLNILNQ